MEQNKKYEKYIYILITIFITWMIVGIAYSSKENELKETISSQNETISQLKADIEEKDGKIESLNLNVENKDEEITELNDMLNPNEELKEVQIDSTDNYVLNKNTKVFHYPYCSSADKMKDSNKKEMKATREEMINKGYKPCGRCNP